LFNLSIYILSCISWPRSLGRKKPRGFRFWEINYYKSFRFDDVAKKFKEFDKRSLIKKVCVLDNQLIF